MLIETPRRSMNRLINSVEGVKREIDEVFIMRAVQSRFAPEATSQQLADVVSTGEAAKNSRPATCCSAKASPAIACISSAPDR